VVTTIDGMPLEVGG